MRFFIETHPTRAEYRGEALGIFTPSGFCVLGIGIGLGGIFVVLFNIGFGFWNKGEEANQYCLDGTTKRHNFY